MMDLSADALPAGSRVTWPAIAATVAEATAAVTGTVAQGGEAAARPGGAAARPGGAAAPQGGAVARPGGAAAPRPPGGAVHRLPPGGAEAPHLLLRGGVAAALRRPLPAALAPAPSCLHHPLTSSLQQHVEI